MTKEETENGTKTNVMEGKRECVCVCFEWVPGEEAAIDVEIGEKGWTWGEETRGSVEARTKMGSRRIRSSMINIIRTSLVLIVSFYNPKEKKNMKIKICEGR